MGNNKPYLFSGIIVLLMGMVVCNTNLCQELAASGNDIFEFFRNFNHLEAEIFMRGATGNGTDDYDPSLAAGGPPPIGSQRANLGPDVRQVMYGFGLQELGRLRIGERAINGRVPPRPLMNLSRGVFESLANAAIGRSLTPPFDPYANNLNFIIVIQSLTYTVLTGLVGATTALASREDRSLAAKYLAMEAGQNSFCRTYLYQRANQTVEPYNITVAEFVNRTSELANQLSKCGLKDEGIEVPRSLGAENRTESNIIAGDFNSLAYSRTRQEMLRSVYGTGDERVPGAFFPNGANGRIAKGFIRRNK